MNRPASIPERCSWRGSPFSYWPFSRRRRRLSRPSPSCARQHRTANDLGERREGSTLHAKPGSWSGTLPMTFTYQWTRCNRGGGSCSAISGSNPRSLPAYGSDIGHTIRVRVHAKNSDGTAAATSKPTRVVLVAGAGARPASTEPPTVSGTPVTGQTLTASPGTWTGRQPIAFSYQWQRCSSVGGGCTAIGGATAATYVLADADLGHTLRVVVTAKNSVGSATAHVRPDRGDHRAADRPRRADQAPEREGLDPGLERVAAGAADHQPGALQPVSGRSQTAPIQVRVHISDTRGFTSATRSSSSGRRRS